MALTQARGTLFVSPTTQVGTLDQAGFDALADWIQITNIVNMPNFDIEDNLITEFYLDTEIGDKQKGNSQGSDTELVIGFEEGNAGHASLLGFAATSLVYPVYRELDNSLGANGTQFYALAVIGGGGVSGGGREDFARRTFQFGITRQRPLQVAAA